MDGDPALWIRKPREPIGTEENPMRIGKTQDEAQTTRAGVAPDGLAVTASASPGPYSPTLGLPRTAA